MTTPEASAAAVRTPLPEGETEAASGFTARALMLAALFIFGTNLAVSKIELVTGRYVASGIPPIPAVTILALLVALTPLVKRLLPRLALRRREILIIYCMMMIAVPFAATYGIRPFLPRLTVLQYFATPENSFAEYARHLPPWFAPTEQQDIVDMYEGTESEATPWGVWVRPLGLWTLFFLALFVTALSMITIMHRHWSQGERLPFPLVQLPMEMVESSAGRGALAGFFTNPVTWVGILLALLYNALNVGNAINPAIPPIEQNRNLSQFFTERPWTALNPLMLATYPMFIGFGYLVSQEVCLSIVVFTAAAKLLAMLGAALGHEQPGFPFFQEQSAGGYVAFGLIMLWLGRGHLREVFGAALRPQAVAPRGHSAALGRNAEVDDSGEPLPYRWAALGLIAGTVFFLGWCSLAGMSWTIALPFWIIVLLFGLTYARVRAEAGIPHDFVYPYRLPQYLILNAIGSRGVLDAGGAQTMLIFSTLSFLSRFHPVQIMTAYQTDAFEVARRSGISRRAMAGGLLIFFVIGLLFAYWGHFSTFYAIGVNALEGRTMSSWRTQDTVGAYGQMVSMIEHPTAPDWTKTGWAMGGALVTLGLVVLRATFLRFPLHPLGYFVALAYGPSTHLWFPFLLVWVFKGLVLKVGGIGTYRRLIPAFIGLSLGHFVFGGVGWPVISLFYDPAVSSRYYTVF